MVDFVAPGSGGMVTISGLKELADAMKELPRRVASKQLHAPVMLAARYIRDNAKGKAPVQSPPIGRYHPPAGTLRNGIIVKRVTEPGRENLTALYVVTVRHGKRYRDYGKKHRNLDAYYWWWVEAGTVHSAPHPFLRPAFEEGKNAALQIIIAGLRQGVETEAAALGPGTSV